jgi:hypothetical protein
VVISVVISVVIPWSFPARQPSPSPYRLPRHGLPGRNSDRHAPASSPARRTATALTAAALLLAAAPALAQTETERVDRTIPFAAGGTITLKNFSGEVRIIGTDASQVVVKADRRATRDRLDRIELDIQTSGSHLTIDANKRQDEGWFESHGNNNVVEIEFDIQVPASSALEVNVLSSDSADLQVGRVSRGKARHDVRTRRTREPGAMHPYATKGRSASRRTGPCRVQSSVTQPSLVTFSAAGPFWPWTTSNSTRSPSARDLKP